MRAIDKINRHSDIITKVSEAKKILDQLEINWETDVAKMDFKKLFNGPPVEMYKYSRMDKLKIEPNKCMEHLFLNFHESERYINLIELMNSGAKIIPPIYIDMVSIKDGIKEVEESLLFMDGMHRQNIASYLQLPEIPIVVFERIQHYIFTPGMWKFEEKPIIEIIPYGTQTVGSYIEAVSPDGKVVTINLQGCRPFSVADDNLEFIKIRGY